MNGTVVCRAAIAGLLVIQVLWFGLLHPPELVPVAVVLAVTVAPLAVVLPGVWRQSPRVLVIAGCLLLVYFSFAVMEAWASPARRPLALAQVIVSASYFAGLLLRRRAARR